VRQRATLILRYHADFDDRTIAATLGCSVETVRSQAHHAIAKLRAHEDALDWRS
jgi:DNA-directed RNA polymerase specialized sigma24 family protein